MYKCLLAKPNEKSSGVGQTINWLCDDLVCPLTLWPRVIGWLRHTAKPCLGVRINILFFVYYFENEICPHGMRKLLGEFTNDSAELYSVLQKQKNANQRTLLKRTDYKSAPTGFYPNLLKK